VVAVPNDLLLLTTALELVVLGKRSARLTAIIELFFLVELQKVIDINLLPMR
jgi:hypothetical protein